MYTVCMACWYVYIRISEQDSVIAPELNRHSKQGEVLSNFLEYIVKNEAVDRRLTTYSLAARALIPSPRPNQQLFSVSTGNRNNICELS